MKAVVPPVSCVRACKPGLVERLEGQHPGRDLRHVLERLDAQRVADLAEQAGGEAAPKSMKTAIPFAVEDRNTEPSSDSAAITSTAEDQPSAGADRVVRPPIAGDPGDQHRADVDRDHVDGAHRRRAGAPAEQQAGPAHRPDHERLEEPALGVAAHRAEREEDSEHGSQEQRREHREPEERRAREHAVVELVVRRERVHLVEGQLRCRARRARGSRR